MRAAEQFSRVQGFRIEEGAAIHISALAAALFVLGGLGYLFEAWNLLYSSAGVVFGAGYTDVHLRLPLIRVMMVLAFVLAGALVYNSVRKRHPWWPAAAFGIWLGSLIVLLGIVPAVYQALLVNPNQLAKEKPYIAFNIAATRAAYDLTAISNTPYSLKGDLSATALKVNGVTVRNIRLWDPQVLLSSYSQLQELRPYYSFTTVSVDRYSVNGVYTQTMLAPRELRVSGLPPQAQTWVNQHITYAHGYGVAVSAVNQVSSGGSPDFLVQNVPGVSSAPALQITQPQIYYGLLGTNYVLVKTKYPTFDYPGPNGDVYSPYTGSGGIPISPFLNRLAFTLRYGDIRFFTSSAITGPEPRDHPRQHPGAARGGGAVPDVRFQPVHGRGRRPPVLDRRRLHDHQPYPLLPAERLDQLHPQLGQGRRRRLQRVDALLRLRPGGPADPHVREDLPRRVPAGVADAGDAASARALPRGLLPRPGGDVRDLPRHRPGRCSTTRATSGRSPATSRSRARLP